MSDEKQENRMVVRVVEYDNPDIVTGRYPFIHEDADEPQLVELRDRYRLDEVAVGDTEFEKQTALLRWRATRFAHGCRSTEEARALGPSLWNGLVTLRAAELGSSFTCPTASIVYIQCCLAMGWPARLVELCKAGQEWIPPTEHNVAHTVSEVWSNQYRKWILMDSDCNLHYERDGVPLSALEVHDAWVRGEAESVALVQGEPPYHSDGSLGERSDSFDEDFEAKRFFKHRVMDYYHEIRITLRNNHLSRTTHCQDGGRGFFPQLVWVEPNDMPMVMRTGGLRAYVHYSGLRNDFDWTLNQAHIEVESGDWRDPFAVTSCLRVNLTTQTPWFSHYEVRVDGGDWRRSPDTFILDCHEGENRVEARVVNRMGVTGPVSSMTVAVGQAEG